MPRRSSRPARNPKIVGLGPGAMQAAAGVTPNRAPIDDIVEALRAAPEFSAEIGLPSPPTYADLERRKLGHGGFYAYAFALDMGLVLKVTDDPDDAHALNLIRQALREKPSGIEGLPFVVEVRRLPGVYTRNETDDPAPRHLYAIVMEFVQPLVYMTEEFDRSTLAKLRVDLKAMAEGSRYELRDSDFGGDKRLRSFAKPILSGLRWLARHGYRPTDLHAANVGYAAGDRPVILDIGHGSKHSEAVGFSIDLAQNGALQRARKHFDACFDTVEEQFPDFGDCELHRDERGAEDSGAGSDRQYGYCKAGDPIVIAFAAKIEELPDANIAGLMRHEFGHAIDFRYGKAALQKKLGRRLPDGVERRADVIAEAVFGEPIEYDERLVQCIDCGGTSPRPRRLPR